MQNAPGGSKVYRLGSRHSFPPLLARLFGAGGLRGLFGFLLGYDGGSCSLLLLLPGSDGTLDRDDQTTEVIQVPKDLYGQAEPGEQNIEHLIVGAALVELEDALLRIAATAGGPSDVGVLVRVVGCGSAIAAPVVAQVVDDLDGFFLAFRDPLGSQAAHQELPGCCDANVGGVGF